MWTFICVCQSVCIFQHLVRHIHFTVVDVLFQTSVQCLTVGYSPLRHPQTPLTSQQPHWLAVVTAAPRGETLSPCSRDEMQRHRFIPNPLLPFHSESFSFYNMTAKTFLDVFFSFSFFGSPSYCFTSCVTFLHRLAPL